ncbi:MAG: hypothetical protein PHI56_08425, partial [Victivallaceae bacterium]|nr:hypothetical protein [Victivallaceae bacterium]
LVMIYCPMKIKIQHRTYCFSTLLFEAFITTLLIKRKRPLKIRTIPETKLPSSRRTIIFS